MASASKIHMAKGAIGRRAADAGLCASLVFMQRYYRKNHARKHATDSSPPIAGSILPPVKCGAPGIILRLASPPPPLALEARQGANATLGHASRNNHLTTFFSPMPHVQTNGINMYYEERGTGEPLICIMGVTAPGGVWEAHANVWQEHFRCILGDNRGVGMTDKPAGPYTTDMMADDYAGLMDALGIKKARVVGCSLGSVIAQKLALRHPEKVQSLILMCTWARQDRFGLYTWEHMMKCKANFRPEDFMHYVQMLIFTKPWFDNDDCWNNMQQGLRDAAINAAPQPCMPWKPRPPPP